LDELWEILELISDIYPNIFGSITAAWTNIIFNTMDYKNLIRSIEKHIDYVESILDNKKELQE
jgi:hypothetical protein